MSKSIRVLAKKYGKFDLPHEQQGHSDPNTEMESSPPTDTKNQGNSDLCTENDYNMIRCARIDTSEQRSQFLAKYINIYIYNWHATTKYIPITNKQTK